MTQAEVDKIEYAKIARIWKTILADLRSSLLGWDQESPTELPIGDLPGVPPVPGSGS